MQIALYIIGDEILAGKRSDKHFAHALEVAQTHSLQIAWVKYLADDPSSLIENFRISLATSEVVFSFGGIGATPDDHTRQAAAAAIDAPLIRHPDAAREIEARFGKEAYPRRILMAELPSTAVIIPNPYNRIPGFQLRQHYFLPGFPEMAWPMMQWVLETYYANTPKKTICEKSAMVFDAVESDLLPLMNDITTAYPSLRLFSLPQLNRDGKRQLELGVKGDVTDMADIDAAWDQIEHALRAANYPFHRMAP